MAVQHALGAADRPRGVDQERRIVGGGIGIVGRRPARSPLPSAARPAAPARPAATDGPAPGRRRVPRRQPAQSSRRNSASSAVNAADDGSGTRPAAIAAKKVRTYGRSLSIRIISRSPGIRPERRSPAASRRTIRSSSAYVHRRSRPPSPAMISAVLAPTASPCAAQAVPGDVEARGRRGRNVVVCTHHPRLRLCILIMLRASHAGHWCLPACPGRSSGHLPGQEAAVNEQKDLQPSRATSPAVSGISVWRGKCY